MGILAKVSPSVANTDVLLYKCPPGKQAVVVVSAVNTDEVEHTVRLAVLNALDAAVAGASVVTGGTGYDSIPQIVVTGKNTTPAVVRASAMTMTGVALNSNGSGYTPGDVLTLVGGVGTAATVRVATTAANGGITSVTLQSGGRYTELLPNGAAADATGGTGTGAKFDMFRYGILELVVVSRGNGYEAAPTLTAPQAGASGFTATVQMTQVVERVDYLEFDAGLAPTDVLERTGLILGPDESLFCRASQANSVNFAVWGIEELA